MEIARVNGEIRLTLSDQGVGFHVDALESIHSEQIVRSVLYPRAGGASRRRVEGGQFARAWNPGNPHSAGFRLVVTKAGRPAMSG